MPHVKGNKFKPKAVEEPVPEPAPADKAPLGMQKKKRRLKQAAAAGAAQEQPAAPAAAAIAIGTQADGLELPPSKKQRRKQQQRQQQPVVPAIPTVVAPPPKPGALPAVAAVAASSNWAALKSAMQQQQQQQQASRPPWKKRQQAAAGGHGDAVQPAVPGNRPQSIGSDTAPTKVLAMDCEMVGVGPGGTRSALARVCVLNSAGNVLLDRFVRPQEKVTDFRTKVSGVRPSDLKQAAPFAEVQRQVAELLKGRILVGHALDNDLDALQLSHPRRDVRDTASGYPLLMRAQARTGKLKPRALRHLAQEQLGLTIQEGEHSPVDDARAALYVYLKHRKDWERWLAAGGKRQARGAAAGGAGGGVGAGQSGGTGSQLGKRKAHMSLEELAANDIMSDL